MDNVSGLECTENGDLSIDVRAVDGGGGISEYYNKSDAASGNEYGTDVEMMAETQNFHSIGGSAETNVVTDDIVVGQEDHVISSGKAFSSYQELESVINNYCMRKGVRLSKSITYMKDKNGVQFVKRGRFKCKKRAKGEDCDFLITFVGETQPGACIPSIYKLRKVCLEHGHALDNPIVQNKEYMKTKRSELEKSEIDFIKLLRHEIPSKICRIMATKFSSQYCNTLISRIKLSIEKDMFGSNRDGISKFIEYGIKAKENGGEFNYQTNNSLVFSCGALQTRDMKLISEKYNDYIIHDGTFGTNVFGLTLLPTVVVDCIGKSAISSILIAETENGEDLISLMKPLNVIEHGNSTYMTDGAPAFSIVANQFDLKHVLCIHHFQCNIDKKLSMNAIERNEFKNLCWKLINIQTTSKFDFELQSLKEKYSVHSGALKYLNTLEGNKTKTCKAFMGKFFTAGGSSSQRSESVNSIIKERGTMTKQQKKHNLFEMATHIEGKFEVYKSKCIVTIQSLVKKNRNGVSLLIKFGEKRQ